MDLNIRRSVPKSGDLSKTDNYRGISLICIIAKIYNRLILRVENEFNKVGLNINAKKTKGLYFNIKDTTPLHTTDGTEIEWVDEFNIRILGGEYRKRCSST